METADKKPIDPDMLLWYLIPSGEIIKAGFKQTGWVVSMSPMPARVMSLHGIMTNGYSTRQAAEEASKVKVVP